LYFAASTLLDFLHPDRKTEWTNGAYVGAMLVAETMMALRLIHEGLVAFGKGKRKRKGNG
jgi:hypothetical protein